MKLSFYGAAHEVTGSMFLLEVENQKILIDCGMEQGIDEYENQEMPCSAASIDAIFLTHAHMDHSGNLPLFYKNGFRGTVYTTRATHHLCEIMLRDSAHIQTFEAEWKNRKAQRAGKERVLPLYNMDDALGVLEHFQDYSYHETIAYHDCISFTFTDAGHLLGSSSITFAIKENGKTTKLVFSGDIGNLDQPLLNNPELLTDADYVIMECTYGDRLHEKRPDYPSALASIISSTLGKGGNLVIPSFAVGRTQEMLYFIRIIKEQKLVPFDFPVYVDSPLAVEATNIFNQNTYGYYDQEAMRLIEKGINPLAFPGLHTSTTSDESKAINFDITPKVILSASGMCEAGRIRHHLKHNLWRKESTILFVGYQATGTLGRALLEGASKVKLFGEEISVCANIAQLNGISAHADQNMLFAWIKHFSPTPKRIFVVHGQSEVCDSFSAFLQEKGLSAYAPYNGAVFDLSQDLLLEEGNKVRQIQIAKPKISAAFQRLEAAGKRLLAIIQRKKGLSNKELARLSNEIDALSDRLENEKEH